jgi:hypothetical protein
MTSSSGGGSSISGGGGSSIHLLPLRLDILHSTLIIIRVSRGSSIIIIT